MGNDETEANKKIITNDNIFFDDNNYRGIQTIFGFDSGNVSGLQKSNLLQYKNNENTLNKIYKNADNISIIPYTFTWKEGGQNVSVIGSFCDWTNFYKMEKDSENIFRVTIHLKRDIYQYKFMVDGQWRHSRRHRTTHDRDGNINNILDLRHENSEISDELSSLSSDGSNKGYKKEKLKKKKLEKYNNNYGCKYPEKNDFNEMPPEVHEEYQEKFKINDSSNQYFIGRIKYLKPSEIGYTTNQSSYRPLLGECCHMKLEHVLFGEDNDDITQIGMTQRYRDKNTTFVYYTE